MKAKGRHNIAVLIALTALSVFSFSCSNSTIGTGSPEDESVEFQVERIHFEDSLADEDGTLYYKAEIDLPVAGPDTLLASIKEWINEELGGSYSGELNCDTAMLESYANYFFENDAESDASGATTQFTIHKIDETELTVTYQMEGYTFSGGANGMPFTKGMTFSKTDGSRYGWNILSDTENLKDILFTAIKEQYFEGNDSDFIQAIEVMVKDTADFPLPETDPWLVGDSIQFVYQPYEIAPFAVGKPSCKVATRELSGLFSQKAKEIIKIQ